MHTPFHRSVLMMLLTMSLSPAWSAAWTDQHSVEAIKTAIQSPIPQDAIQKARALDDQIMQRGTIDQLKVYLVTDARLSRVDNLVSKLLSSMGEKASGWVVRVLDTDPRVANAFVAGGKYIYVFTGLIDQAQSDDELAFVLGHELGHSLLKHNIRKAQDLTTTLANLAMVIAVSSGGNTKATASAISSALSANYSRDDEREADAFAVAISSRTGFSPLRGADFFTRSARVSDKEKGDRDTQLQEYRDTVGKLQAECAALQQQWSTGRIQKSQQNANILNQKCSLANTHAAEYNRTLSAAQLEDSRAVLSKTSGTHPDQQERIAAIAALSDYIKGVRPLESLANHAQGQKVMTALVQTDSTLLTASPAPLSPADAASSGSVGASPSGPGDNVAARMARLKDLYDRGLIEKAEYEAKKQELLREL